MVTTDQAVPHVFDTFGEGIEHLPVIGNMTYNYFLDNFAYQHDVSYRPMFEEFVSHVHSSLSPTFLATDECMPDTEDEDLIDGDEGIFDDGDIDDLDLEF